MEIKINKGQIITTCILGAIGWFAVETYNHGQRITALEQKTKSDNRQDTELSDIRESIQDMIVLFFEKENERLRSKVDNEIETESNNTLLSVPRYDNTLPNKGFSTAQNDLKSLINRK